MERNLDLDIGDTNDFQLSFPAMGTWIEIIQMICLGSYLMLSFPAMGTWIEIVCAISFNLN